jgi:hypothetical protein
MNTASGCWLTAKRVFDISSVGIYTMMAAGYVNPDKFFTAAAGSVMVSPYLSASSAILGGVSLLTNAGQIVTALCGRDDPNDTPLVTDLRSKFSKAASRFAIQETLASISTGLASLSLLHYSHGASGDGVMALPLGIALSIAGITVGWHAHRNADRMSVYEKAIESELRKPSAPPPAP